MCQQEGEQDTIQIGFIDSGLDESVAMNRGWGGVMTVAKPLLYGNAGCCCAQLEYVSRIYFFRLIYMSVVYWKNIGKRSHICGAQSNLS